MVASEPAWKTPSPSSARPDQRKLCSSMQRRPMRLIRRVAMMQPMTNSRVIATEP